MLRELKCMMKMTMLNDCQPPKHCAEYPANSLTKCPRVPYKTYTNTLQVYRLPHMNIM